MLRPRFITLTAMIFGAALSRLLPHPWNMTPVAAMALFGGASFSKKGAAFLVPLAALGLSDLLLGAYRTMPFVYGSFAIIVGLGLLIRRRRSASSIALAAAAGSVLFFLITNAGDWLMTGFYPKTFQGFVLCLDAGIPFFRNTLAGDAFYSLLLFGGMALLEKEFPVLKENSPTALSAWSPQLR